MALISKTSGNVNKVENNEQNYMELLRKNIRG